MKRQRAQMLMHILPFLMSGYKEDVGGGERIPIAGFQTGTAEFHPRKHTYKTYAAQNREAKKRRKIRAKSKK